VAPYTVEVERARGQTNLHPTIFQELLHRGRDLRSQHFAVSLLFAVALENCSDLFFAMLLFQVDFQRAAERERERARERARERERESEREREM
jgi:hypothetical protein